MANEKHRRLVETLHSKTAEGKLDWREADFQLVNEAYQIDLAMNSLRISKTTNQDGAELIVINLLNSDGRIVESFSDEDIDTDHRYYNMMKDLHEMASRRALGSDEVLDSILSELNDDLPF